MRAVIVKADSLTPSLPQPARLNLDDWGRQADQIVSKARAEAARIIDEASRQADAVRRDAEKIRRAAAELSRAEGFERGQAEGREAGRQEEQARLRERFAAEAEQTVSTLQAVVAELRAHRNGLMADAADGVLAVAIAIVQRLAPRLAEASPEMAIDAVREAIEAVDSGRDVVIRLHPDDHDMVRQYAPTFCDDRERPFRLLADPEMTRGGARVATIAGEVDATVEGRLERIADALLAGWKARVPRGTTSDDRDA